MFPPKKDPTNGKSPKAVLTTNSVPEPFSSRVPTPPEAVLSAFSEASMPLILPRHQVQDIDTEDDWKRSELLFHLIKKDNNERQESKLSN